MDWADSLGSWFASCLSHPPRTLPADSRLLCFHISRFTLTTRFSCCWGTLTHIYSGHSTCDIKTRRTVSALNVVFKPQLPTGYLPSPLTSADEKVWLPSDKSLNHSQHPPAKGKTTADLTMIVLLQYLYHRIGFFPPRTHIK